MAPGKKDANQNEALSLDVSLKLATDGMHLFFRNQFQDAKALYEINCGHDPYSATGLAMLHVAHAFFTMEKPLIEEALEAVNNTLKIVDPLRKPGSISGAISKWFTKTNYNDYTDVEAHAELLSLEMNFLYTVLSFMSEQSFTSLFKAARSSMSAHSSAKLCYQLMTQKTNWESDMIKRNFDVGSLVCWGMMNLLFSHLPARVVKIISLVGLPGNRDEGLECMKKATDDDMVSTMRHKMASFYVCMYSFYLEQMLGVGQLDIEWIKKLTDDGLRHFPDGAFDLYWAAKTYQLRGHCDKAIDLYQKSIDSQQEFKPIHSACRWDMLWCHAVQFDWQSAADLANSSLEEVNEAMHLFFANHFNEAASRLEPKSHHDIYHSAGLTMIKGAHACFTMEKPLLKDALISIRKCAQLCETYRKPASITGAISGWFTKTDYNEYSDGHAQAVDFSFIAAILDLMGALFSLLGGQGQLGTSQGPGQSSGRYYAGAACEKSKAEKDTPFLAQCLYPRAEIFCDGDVTDVAEQRKQEARCARFCYRLKPNFFLLDDAKGNTGCGIDPTDQYDDFCVCGVPWTGTAYQGVKYDFLRDKSMREDSYRAVVKKEKKTNSADYDRKVDEAKAAQAKRAEQADK
ncbi:Tetratricopeptide repeat protein 39B [Halotydeus destructor]|nr:Tetratricopeptide repeat protein 39B [Halotydeus destructor]